jgi:sugar lactone lactonase YvrE
MAVPAFAGGGVPYLGYNYGYWRNVVPSPAAYVPGMTIGAPNIDASLGQFRNPEDMFVAGNKDIYLADTGNNRIVVFDNELNLKKIVDSFDNNGRPDKFSSPNGVFVAEDLRMFVADTDNHRIVVLDSQGKLLKIVSDPQYDTLEDNFVFAPLKVCVDKADRVYAIVKNVYEGIMCFDSDGTFFGYFGTVKVRYNPIDWFWRQISTSTQRSKQILFIPVEFASMDIDEAGFIYTTNIERGDTNNKVKRLNPSGEDVLINYNERLNIIGDMHYRLAGRLSGASSFIDVKTRSSGMYSALDATRSRLYTYDSEGNLLYIIGGPGNTLGTARYPTAVEVLDNNILILDRQRGEIVYYQETEYGRLINEAVALRYEGDESSAVDKWYKVLSLNENYTLAHTGIGKSLLAAGKNKEAMAYLKKGMSVEYYSVAFKRYRNELLKRNMSLILTLITLAVAIIVAIVIYRRLKQKKIRFEIEKRENEARAAKLRGQTT